MMFLLLVLQIISLVLVFGTVVVDASYECSALLDAKGARRILPSVVQQVTATTAGDRPIPNIYVPSRNITLRGDVEHVVIPPTDNNGSYLKVFLPATLSSPVPFSCFLESLSGPVIGLMYEWLHDADANRATQCMEKYNSNTSAAYSACLTSGTEDAFRGGRREGIWQQVHPMDSIEGRLTLLLEYLNNTYPTEGWGRFLVEEPATSTTTYGTDRALIPSWPDIWLMGHSQGAGHTAYLAQAYELRGAGIMGGPQQLCASSSCWTNRPWKTSSIRVLAHRDEEYYDVIVQNLNNIPVEDGPFVAFTTLYDITNLTAVEKDDDANRLPQNLPWVTSIPMYPQASCGTIVGPHCSLAVDNNAPVSPGADLSANKTVNPAIYATSVWPQLAGLLDTPAPTTATPTAAPSSPTTTIEPTSSSSTMGWSRKLFGASVSWLVTTTAAIVGGVFVL
eukprot:scaffold6829_cov171-Amphora_coffeaeformis.AAC.15